MNPQKATTTSTHKSPNKTKKQIQNKYKHPTNPDTPITLLEVKIKNKKNTGPYKLPYQIIRRLSDNKNMTKLYNKILDTENTSPLETCSHNPHNQNWTKTCH